MAHIFKMPKGNQKGIVVFTHKEVPFIQGFPGRHSVKSRYLVGVYYGGFSLGVKRPPWADFIMGNDAVIDSGGRYRIPFHGGNFVSSCFQPNKEVIRWDIINISRPNRVKKVDVFFREIKKIYDLGHKVRVLLLCPARHEETAENHHLDVTEMWYKIFTKEERDLFLYLRISKEMHYDCLGLPHLATFFQMSKVVTLFSAKEGFPRSIAEGLCCGCRAVVYSGMLSGIRRVLNSSNSIQFGDYNQAHLALLKAIETPLTLADTQYAIERLREDYTIPLLKNHFSKLYEQHGMEFDGELINTDNLSMRLPAHFISVPWGRGDFMTADIKSKRQYDIFRSHL